MFRWVNRLLVRAYVDTQMNAPSPLVGEGGERGV